MPDLLLELRSEEIPARMQRKAAGDLKKMVTDGLVEAGGLTYEAASEYWTPRRLALRHSRRDRALQGRARGDQGPADKGARAGDPGFCAQDGAGLDRRRAGAERPQEGRFLRRPDREGRAGRPKRSSPTSCRASFAISPGLKSMRWGAASAKPGSLRWVRPLQSILCTFGPETEEPVVVDFRGRRGSVRGNVTYGHRFHAPRRYSCGAASTTNVAKLEAAKVDPRRRAPLSASYSTTPRTWPSPRGWKSSRTRACWKKSRAWSNGRSCCSASLRRRIPRHSRRGDPADHPGQPEMFRHAAAAPHPSCGPPAPDPPHQGGGVRAVAALLTSPASDAGGG